MLQIYYAHFYKILISIKRTTKIEPSTIDFEMPDTIFINLSTVRGVTEEQISSNFDFLLIIALIVCGGRWCL